MQKLTAKQVDALKPKKDKPYKVFFGDGLHILVSKTGAKLWRFKYSYLNKGKTLSIGRYPEIGIADAREAAFQARKAVASGRDPSAEKIQAKYAALEASDNSFQVVALAWLKAYSGLGYTPSERLEKEKKETFRCTLHQGEDLEKRLEKYVFPTIGKMPISSITSRILLKMLKNVATVQSAHMSGRCSSLCTQVFEYALGHDLIETVPTTGIRKNLPTHREKNRPAYTEEVDAGRLFRLIDTYWASAQVCGALKFSALCLARPGEIRRMRWSEINFEKKQWVFRVEKKICGEHPIHICPLADQSLRILEELRSVTGEQEFVFGQRGKKPPMSENTVNQALRNLGIDTKTQHCAHGFRAVARTLIREELKYSSEIIERQLSHMTKEELGPAYDRTKFLKDRVAMMREWADQGFRTRTSCKNT